MALTVGQQFVESVDGSRTVFTAQAAFTAGTVQVYQGNLPLTPLAYREISTLKVRTMEPSSHQTWTVHTVDDTIYCAGHGLQEDDPLVVWSTVTLPTGLLQTGIYYVLAGGGTNTFQIAASPGGDAIEFTDAGADGTLYLATPLAPISADGLLWYTAETLVTETIDPATVVGFWELSAWQAQYAPEASLAMVRDVLTDANADVVDYVTEAFYALAETEQPPYRLFRRVIGELAFFFISRRPGTVQQVSSAKKEYGDGVKKMSQSYSVQTSSLMKLSRMDILGQLVAYKKTGEEAGEEEESVALAEAGAFLHSWGTNRHFGLLESEVTQNGVY